MLTTQSSQEQMCQVAWDACQNFRRPYSAAHSDHLVLVMLFLKYISDVAGAENDSFSFHPGEQGTGESEKPSRRRFCVPKGSSFYDLHFQTESLEMGRITNNALRSLAAANPNLEGVFEHFDFDSDVLGGPAERSLRIKELLANLARPELDFLPLNGSMDSFGACYIYLISRISSDLGKLGNEFYTPAGVAALLAKLTSPKTGDTICDPACGSGSLLIRAAELAAPGELTIYGQEINVRTWALARMNMLLHFEDTARIEWCDTLMNPTLVDGDRLMQFDVVISNPPFGLQRWGIENAMDDRFRRFWRGLPPKSRGDYAFITHMIEIAKPSVGRTALTVPHGALFRSGAEGQIRQALVEENLLDAVIGLPANLFFATSIPTAILVFDRSREVGGVNSDRHDVLFIDASQDYESRRPQNIMSEGHIARVLETYASRSEMEGYSYRATFEAIEANGFSLGISRYINNVEPKEEFDINNLLEEIDHTEMELALVRAEILKFL